MIKDKDSELKQLFNRKPLKYWGIEEIKLFLDFLELSNLYDNFSNK